MDIKQGFIFLRKASKEVLKDHAFAVAPAAALLWILPGWLRYCLLLAGALLFLCSVIGPIITDWKPRAKVLIGDKAVVISGCDSGFGHMLAQKLDDLGFRVFAGCLQPTGEGAQNLKKSTSVRLHIFELDVTKNESVQKAVEYVNEHLKGSDLWAVVCNAGINDGAEIMWTSLETMQRVIDVNMYGVVRVTKAFLPQLCKSKGRVVAVASAAGRYTYPGMVAYCMSKQGVVSFCDGLRLEMYKFGVQVVTVEPWMYKTPITDEEAIQRYIKKTWDEAPEEIRNFFPPDYPGMYSKSTNKFVNYSISHKPSEVVACLEEAVTAVHPKYSYSPGTLYSRFSFWFLRRLPKELADLILLDLFHVRWKA